MLHISRSDVLRTGETFLSPKQNLNMVLCALKEIIQVFFFGQNPNPIKTIAYKNTI